VNRDLIHRPEYLTMGFASTVQAGRSLASFGATDEPWQLSASASKGFRLAQPGHQLLASGSLSSLYGSTVGDSRSIGGALRYFAPQTNPMLLYLALSTDHVHSRALFTAEERYYTDWYPLRLFRVGAVAFFDVGRAWGGQTPNPVNGWLSDIGFGLRFLSARASFGNTLHVDLAFPLNRGDGSIRAVQLLVQTGRTF
jgi:outer membrane translocation and assembly module TamA